MAVAKIQYLRDSKDFYGKEGAKTATENSCGVDLRAILDSPQVIIEAGERYPVPTGIAIEILQENIACFLYSRSGLGAKKGLTIAQGVGVIDPDYRGEIIAYMLNTSQEAISIEQGDRIAQIVFQPYVKPLLEESETLSETKRGTGGYGHTGLK